MMIQALKARWKQVERGEAGPGFDEQELRNQSLSAPDIRTLWGKVQAAGVGRRRPRVLLCVGLDSFALLCLLCLLCVVGRPSTNTLGSTRSRSLSPRHPSSVLLPPSAGQSVHATQIQIQLHSHSGATPGALGPTSAASDVVTGVDEQRRRRRLKRQPSRATGSPPKGMTLEARC